MESEGVSASVAAVHELGGRTQQKLDLQLEAWRDQLLAMDRRQRLLYFKHLKTGSLEFDSDPLATLGMLGAAAAVPIRSAPEDPTVDGTDRAIYVGGKPANSLQASLRRIDHAANQAYLDRGVWTLHLGVLMLHWTDSADTGEQIDSPLLLVPVQIQKIGPESSYGLSRAEGDISVNPVLCSKLERDYELILPSIDPDDDLSAETFGSLVSAAISGRVGWRIEQRMVLSNFTFQKEAMYRDLRDNHAEIAGHDIVRLLTLGPDAPKGVDYAFEPVPLADLDHGYAPEDLFSILDADSSQRRCIISAAKGKSFVMDGPPGTGKSQTIANIIAELMATGRSVLFVSEKAAALDVVRDRLAAAHLRHFLFELHSHSATRKEVAAELARALNKRIDARDNFSAGDRVTLLRDRRALTDFAEAMNESDRNLRRSVFWALGRMLDIGVELQQSVTPSSRWCTLSTEEFDQITTHGRQLGRSWRAAVGGYKFVWRDLARTDLGSVNVRELGRLAASTRTLGEQLRSRLANIDDELALAEDSAVPWDMTTESIDRRCELLRLLTSCPGIDPTWYQARDLDRRDNRAANARDEVARLTRISGALEETAGPRWRSIDPKLGDELGRTLESGGVKNACSATELRFVHQALEKLVPVVDLVMADAEELGKLLGVSPKQLTLQRAVDLTQLARLAASPHRPDSAWLNRAHIKRVSNSVATLEAAVGHVVRYQESLRATFTSAALELDLRTLAARFHQVHKGLRRWSPAAREDKQAIKLVAVSGRCDRETVSRLDEAASWQQAVNDMEKAARGRGADLGARYQGPATEFQSIRTALENARRVLALAPVGTHFPTLASQVADGSMPSPQLIPVADRLTRNLAEYQRILASMPGSSAAVYGERAAFDKNRNRMMSDSAAAVGAAKVVDAVSAIVGRELTVGEANAIVTDVARYSALEASFEDHRTSDTAMFGASIGVDTDFDVLIHRIRHTRDVQSLFKGRVSPCTASCLASARVSGPALEKPFSSWKASRQRLVENFAETRRDALAGELDDLDDAIGLLDDMNRNAVADIEDWCTAQRAIEYLEPLGFGPAIDELRSLPRTNDEVARAVEYGALEAWVDTKSQHDPRLHNYRAMNRDDLVHEFRNLDRSLTRNTHARVIAECNRRLPTNLNSRAAQVIKREGEKKTRHKAVRVLLEEVAPLVQKLKPCFMMSPLSVSQYLPKSLVFDVVIFDEASQVHPSDAINCVYRARQLIVAGDQKQLPPTDFFAATAEDSADDDEQLDALDFQSVLDLAKSAGGLTALPLSWHYRSRHEDLIAYSNHRFYSGELMTFPSAVFDAPDLGVSLQRVDGVYNRGTSRDNPIEAAKVAERVAWFKKHRPTDSIGVVTFSAAQQDRILQTIEAEADRRPELAGILAERDRLDGFFVKSLENVQGDERDIVIFSLGYGPDENGKFTSTFGPLNKDGGWRRLNVAITRARKRVEIVSSFSAAEMPPSDNPSVRHLQGYLDFVERGAPALAIDVESGCGDVDSVFEEQVLAAVRSFGYDVVPQVGVAGYRIDLGVRHPDRPGEYLLGIECDGAAYHSAQTARDRDRLREEVLVGLGWRIHRIWGLSWWRDRQTQLDRLRAVIEAALREQTPTEIASTEEPTADKSVASSAVDMRDDSPSEVLLEDTPSSVERDWVMAYVRYETIPAQTRDPLTPDGLADLRDFFSAVIAVEAPVHKDLLDERFRHVWGISRIGKRVRESVDRALARAHPGGADEDGFYHLTTDCRGVRGPSVDAMTRRAHQVPSNEIRVAAARIVEESVVVDGEMLVRQIATVFGWSRLSNDIKVAIRSVLEDMNADGSLLSDAADDFTLGDSEIA